MKRCEDYAYTGVECCEGCHYEYDHEDELQRGFDLITIQIDGEMAKVCCTLAYFFYPDGSWKDRSKTGQWSRNE